MYAVYYSLQLGSMYNYMHAWDQLLTIKQAVLQPATDY